MNPCATVPLRVVYELQHRLSDSDRYLAAIETYLDTEQAIPTTAASLSQSHPAHERHPPCVNTGLCSLVC